MKKKSDISAADAGSAEQNVSEAAPEVKQEVKVKAAKPGKGKKGKKDRKKEPEKKLKFRPLKPRKTFAFLPNFWIFCALWVFCLIFTQALRSPLSSILFIFVTFIPYICLAYVFIARSALEVGIDNSCSEATKMEPVTFNVMVNNTKPIPIPFVEADLLIPNESSVRCTEQRMYLALAPLSHYEIKKTVTFCYRGQYSIGVSNFYVYDFFKFFRLKRREEEYNPVFVLPRRKVLDVASESAASDVNTESQKNTSGIDRAEMSDVRQYRQGDHMKTVHWKLSSKTQDLQVKQYAMNSGKTAYIFVDLAAHYKLNAIYQDDVYEDDINEYAIDGIIELAIAAAMRELKAGNTCKLIWYDKRIPGETQVCYMESPEDFERSFTAFATAELCTPDKEMTKLVALVEETQGVSMTFVTSCLDSRLVDGMSEASSILNNVSSAGAIEMYYFNPAKMIISPKVKAEAHDTAESCKLQLQQSGIRVLEMNL